MDTSNDEQTTYEQLSEVAFDAHMLCEQLLARHLPNYLRTEVAQLYERTAEWVTENLLH